MCCHSNKLGEWNQRENGFLTSNDSETRKRFNRFYEEIYKGAIKQFNVIETKYGTFIAHPNVKEGTIVVLDLTDV